MPTQTRFICTSGVAEIDLSGVFEDLNGGSSYGSATRFKVGSIDLTGYFYASSGEEDRPNFNTGFKVKVGATSTDLSAIFRRRGYVSEPPPIITSQPSNAIIVNNTTATFSITATGNSLSYKWQKLNGSWADISGATSSSYSITNATTANDASYRCIVSNPGGSVTSNAVVLKIKPYITSQPISVSDDDLETNGFSITAGGSATLNFTWYKGATIVAGPRTGIISSTQDQHVFQFDSSTAGTYYCKVTNDPYDSTGVQSNSVTATIIAPTITSFEIVGQPASGSYNYDDGNQPDLVVVATGTNLSYQWYRNGNPISGATSSTYIPTIGAVENGTYKCRVSNNGGFVDTNTITIVRYYAATITVQPSSTTVFVNGSNDGVFTITATGMSSPTYQWQEDIGGTPTDIVGAASSTLTINDVTNGDDGRQFLCKINNKKADGTTDWYSAETRPTSSTVTLSANWIDFSTNVDEGPFTLNDGEVFAVSLFVDANPAASYQWQYSSNNSSYSDLAINDRESLNDVTDSGISFVARYGDEGYYRCVITAGVAQKNSNAGHLETIN
jgi:hypothetical protein